MWFHMHFLVAVYYDLYEQIVYWSCKVGVVFMSEHGHVCMDTSLFIPMLVPNMKVGEPPQLAHDCFESRASYS